MSQTSQLHRTLQGRTLLMPRMNDESVVTFAAAFRSIGIECRPVPPSNERTLELGSRFCSGEECYPEKITTGDFLRAIEEQGSDKVAFFMPTAEGPCRFGQYAPYLMKVLREIDHSDIPVVTPSSTNSYDELGDQSSELMRTAWRALLVADILRSLCLRFRPYEARTGDADQALSASLDDASAILERPGLKHSERMKLLVESIARAGRRFGSLPLKPEKRPLVGVVGEIFCRMANFSNENLIRRIEAHGGECWLSGITEWVFYTNRDHINNLIRKGKSFSLSMLKAQLKNKVQQHEEHELMAPVKRLLEGREEAHDIRELLQRGLPYLPHTGVLGEMVLSVGKAIYLYDKGAHGIAEISPFSCMNGIVCEAVYPKISADHNGIPIRVFYFDGTQKAIDQEVGIFMELARNYQRRAGHAAQAG